MDKLKKLQEKLAKARADISKVFEQAGDSVDFSKVTELSGTDAEKCSKIQQMSKDAEVLGKEVSELNAVFVIKERNEREEEAAKSANRPAFVTGKAPAVESEARSNKGIGDLFVEAKAHEKGNRDREIELKTDFTRTAGWAPESFRTGRLVDYAVRPIQVIDIIPGERTGEAAIKYMEETTLSSALAVEKAEGAAFGEAQLALTERSVTVEKLPVYLPVTDEQLADVLQAASYINNRLPAMLMRRLDSQALNGDGATPNMRGVLNASNLQAQLASAGDGNADTILRAITAVRVTGRAIASAILLNPTDWLNERLRKTKDGAYIWGNPAEVGITSMWGLPVAQADALAQGTAVVGDFRAYSAYVERQGIIVKTGYINDDFIKGRQAIRADMRGAFVWYRGAAFCEVTLPVA